MCCFQQMIELMKSVGRWFVVNWLMYYLFKWNKMKICNRKKANANENSKKKGISLAFEAFFCVCAFLWPQFIFMLQKN